MERMVTGAVSQTIFGESSTATTINTTHFTRICQMKEVQLIHVEGDDCKRSRPDGTIET
jgi:phosphoribulokinase